MGPQQGPPAAQQGLAAEAPAWLARWELVPDGNPVATAESWLLPVLRAGRPAMLKITEAEEERRGAALLAWWAGEGAARVLARDGAALLLERAASPGSLAAMARHGADDAATRILCGAAARLHAPRPGAPPGLVPLDRWFAALGPAAAIQGGWLRAAAAAATALLAAPHEPVPLHGDLHHGNLLDFGPRGWLAIDPKGLFGERGFDYANLFCNPDLADPLPPVATLPDRFARRVAIVAATARLDRARLLRWILAWTGLSAAWHLAEGEAPAPLAVIAALAEAALAA